MNMQKIKKGTMWDYETSLRRQQWVATSEKEGIRYTHAKFQAMPVNKWIGHRCQVGNTGNILIEQISRRHSQVFIPTTPDQVITCIAPPIWVWSDAAMTAGAWCIVATSYVDYWDDPGLNGTYIGTGLVLMNALKVTDKYQVT